MTIIGLLSTKNFAKPANREKTTFAFDPRAAIELRCGGLRPRTTRTNYLLHRNQKQPTATTTKGDISNELTMGTFLMNFDSTIASLLALMRS
jgi:hypothetical protein